MATAAVARAGEYVIANCPSAGNGNAGSWTVFGSPQTDKASCGGGAGDWIGPQGGSMNPNTSAGVQITAPAGSGVTIQQARVWWKVPSPISGATMFAEAGTDAGGIGGSGTPLDRSFTPDDFTLPSTTTNFKLVAYCSSDDGANGCSEGSGEDPILQLLGAQLTLSDSNPPSGSVTGGGLSGEGPVAGTQALTFNADDSSSGVRLVQLLVDGQVVATNDYLAQCPYQDFAACPTAIADSIGWNTASASNGPHAVALRIVNAAQVATVIDDHLVTLHNPPHIPNGSPACESAHLALSVNGKGRSARVRWGRVVRATGRLVCGLAPIVNATVVVSGGGLSTTVTTNQLGEFTYRVPRGPNRKITFGYRAFADDARPATRAAVRLWIVPRISLAITPRHTANGGSIFWIGRLRGGPYPRGGVSLLAEVKEGHRWQTFDQIVAYNGRFGYRYTFLRTTQPTRYQLRVALPANGSAGYDYTPGASNAVTVHVS